MLNNKKWALARIFNCKALGPKEEYERSFVDIHEKVYNGVGGNYPCDRQHARGKWHGRAYRGAYHWLHYGPGIFRKHVHAAVESRAAISWQCEAADALGVGFATTGIIYRPVRSRPDFYAGVQHGGVGLCPLLCMGYGSYDPHE